MNSPHGFLGFCGRHDAHQDKTRHETGGVSTNASTSPLYRGTGKDPENDIRWLIGGFIPFKVPDRNSFSVGRGRARICWSSWIGWGGQKIALRGLVCNSCCFVQQAKAKQNGLDHGRQLAFVGMASSRKYDVKARTEHEVCLLASSRSGFWRGNCWASHG